MIGITPGLVDLEGDVGELAAVHLRPTCAWRTDRDPPLTLFHEHDETSNMMNTMMVTISVPQPAAASMRVPWLGRVDTTDAER